MTDTATVSLQSYIDLLDFAQSENVVEFLPYVAKSLTASRRVTIYSSRWHDYQITGNIITVMGRDGWKAGWAFSAYDLSVLSSPDMDEAERDFDGDRLLISHELGPGNVKFIETQWGKFYHDDLMLLLESEGKRLRGWHVLQQDVELTPEAMEETRADFAREQAENKERDVRSGEDAYEDAVDNFFTGGNRPDEDDDDTRH